jgi:hypothetical protein
MLIAAYMLLVYAGQVGYCVLLVIARKSETKVCQTHHGRGVPKFSDRHVANHCKRHWFEPGVCKLGNGILGYHLGKISSLQITLCIHDHSYYR